MYAKHGTVNDDGQYPPARHMDIFSCDNSGSNSAFSSHIRFLSWLANIIHYSKYGDSRGTVA